ncbi:uncharacterized protein N7484_005510 [Penicillium longicatenatum]|uniref:uncharacterized protein n=1 Tax=Penicillium longicatenatum TaxID=1561947 RepID=UPI00254866E4|nr:uncharacterized protein N7484_005510 [Penicillium longicatenatum]KAJ5643003.1 hypothetical protein N7484_005510 [Penicillium longicatenatum]
MSGTYADGYLRQTSEVPKDRLKSFIGRLNKSKQAALHNCLIIGIDFGTTYSGVSWVTLADFKQENINIITQWPGVRGDHAKVPTKLYYEYGPETYTPLWGFEIPHDIEALEWFKLLLLRDDDMWKDLQESVHIGRAKMLLRESGKTAEDCIADYLRAIWKHTLKTILKARPSYLVESLEFHVVLTVPAIWKDYARSAMTEAAKKAGILDDRPAGPTSLTFAPEPEAAGLAALIERGSDTKPDDVFVICDAGGGTVDVITYKVGHQQPLQLHEAVEGDGSVCGGIFIDEDFTVQCRNRIGRKWSGFSPADRKAILTNEWEYSIKPSLNDTSRKPHIKDGHIFFSGSDIRDAFHKRAVPGLLRLVENQLTEAQSKGLRVTGIVLVGGLGSSPHIYKCLVAKYSSRGIEICQSSAIRRRTAICRGAILKGLMDAPITTHVPNAPEILSRISRMCIGTSCIEEFKKGVHHKKERYMCKHEGYYKVRGMMDWYITKGEDVAKSHAIRKDYYRTFINRKDFPPSSFTINMYKSEAERPPARLSDASVMEHSTLEFDLSDYDYDDLEDFKGLKGQRGKKFNYTIEMVPSGASTEFSIYFQGKKVGSDYVSIMVD